MFIALCLRLTGKKGLDLFDVSQKISKFPKLTDWNLVFRGCNPFLALKVSLQCFCWSEISCNEIFSCRAVLIDAMAEFSMESEGGLGSGGLDRKSLTGLDLAGR